MKKITLFFVASMFCLNSNAQCMISQLNALFITKEGDVRIYYQISTPFQYALVCNLLVETGGIPTAVCATWTNILQRGVRQTSWVSVDYNGACVPTPGAIQYATLVGEHSPRVK